MNLHPQPWTEPVTARQAIGHLETSKQQHAGGRRQELIDAWRKCQPGKWLRKTVPNVSSFESIRLDPERPSLAILSGVGGTTTGLVHPWEVRKLTMDEAKALASYPKAFEIRGNYNVRWARIGNSVPPLLMRAIAEHIRRSLRIAGNHPAESPRSTTC